MAIPERFRGYRSDLYSNDDNWLCKPGIAKNYCLTEELDSTIVAADGTATPAPHKAVKDAPVDCFYVYPTVNLKAGGGNDMGMSDEIGVEVAVLKTQGARFTETCNVYAPIYRQMNLSGYQAPPAERDKSLEIAYADVLDAFKDYLANHNNGRPFILIGHSQGSGHLATLLQREFDDDAVMKSKLVSALLVGGFVNVPTGKDVGGTFKHLPLCRSMTQTTCVVEYNSFGTSPPPDDTSGFGETKDGMEGACVNPASPAGGSGVLKSYVPDSGKVSGIAAVTTPFVQLPATMTAECIHTAGSTYLGITASAPPGDARDVSKLVTNVPGWGLHISEFNLTMGSLLDLVQSQLATVK